MPAGGPQNRATATLQRMTALQTPALHTLAAGMHHMCEPAHELEVPRHLQQALTFQRDHLLPGHYGFKKGRENGVLRSTCPHEVAQVCAAEDTTCC